MAIAMKILLILSLLLACTFSFTKSTTTVSAVYKDQMPCTMCYLCDNPCQPLASPPPPPIPECPPPPSPPPPPLPECPPPPPIPECPPPPSPPPPALPECPPPPAPVHHCSECPPNAIPIPSGPPAPIKPGYEPPAGGEFYAPPGSGYGTNPTPYFPNYMPPQPSSATDYVHLKLMPMIIAVLVSFTALCCF
ncbi:hypothetical protein JCGZ_13989 [Jatropha curcas]|uniref:Uncharacterized protein n=1 Tax=Jatropha curcas TaxID=180498 RepID=A0A067JZN6_JATCU|nr:hypothetical protein JCGZ_13989 [Jatropha curcas]